MSRWKASLPRVSPPNGVVSMVFATCGPFGTRAEASGEITEVRARLMWLLLNMNESKLTDYAQRIGFPEAAQ